MSQEAELRLQFQYVQPSIIKYIALSHPATCTQKSSKNPTLHLTNFLQQIY